MDTVVWILRSIKQKAVRMFFRMPIFLLFAWNCKYELFSYFSPTFHTSEFLYIRCTMCLVIFSFLQINNKEKGKFLGSYFTFQKFFYWHCSSLARATEIIICTRVCKKFNSTDKLYALQMIYCFIGNRSRHRVVINRFWMNKKR